jgi:hypothetical protein
VAIVHPGAAADVTVDAADVAAITATASRVAGLAILVGTSFALCFPSPSPKANNTSGQTKNEANGCSTLPNQKTQKTTKSGTRRKAVTVGFTAFSLEGE